MKQIRKMMEKGKSSFWLKGFIWLFCIMFLFTVISKVTDSFSVAKVKVSSPSARKLQYTVTAEGRIEKNRELSVLTQPELLVKSVLVSEGQRVKKGDVLAKLDLDQLEERIQSINGEKKALELQNQAVETNRNKAEQRRRKAMSQAQGDYTQLRKENKAALANARKGLAKAEKELAAAQKKMAEEGKGSGQGQAVAEKKQAVTEKKKALEELQAAAAKEEKEAERAIEEAKAEPEADNSVEVNNISIRSLQGQIDKLLEIKRQKGQILAPETGVITGVLVNVGQRTQDSGVFTMTDDSAGLKFAGQISVPDAKYVSVGDGIVLESADQKREDISVTSLEMDASKEFMNITALLPADAFSLGETVTMTARQESENYPCTVPVTSLRQESGRNFILMVQSEDTVLGEQEVARQVEVTVLEKNDSYAALKTGTLDEESQVITESDKFVQTGERVRSSTMPLS